MTEPKPEQRKAREFWIAPDNDTLWIKNFDPIEKYDKADFAHNDKWAHVREVLPGEDERAAGVKWALDKLIEYGAERTADWIKEEAVKQGILKNE
jgi:hypothetical protein